MARQSSKNTFPLRTWFVLVVFASVFFVLIGRAIYLQVLHSDYLKKQGDARYLRVLEDNAVRGMILDRNGAPLAISTPVDSIWAHPSTLFQARQHWPALASILGLKKDDIRRLLKKHDGREFIYLKRHVTPELSQRVMALKVPGVSLQREYRRYYPIGAVSGHIVGFTDIDDQGQEGLELLYDPILRATPGKKRIIKDRLGNVVEAVESLSLPVPGKDLIVSLDRRIQYLVYRELKAAFKTHRAQAASAIVLDAHTGEILAMVNEPDFNPNNRTALHSGIFRNRAVTDVLEPGSTLKPFTIAAALEDGLITPDTYINTRPGTLRIGHKVIRDSHDHGRLTVAGIIEKSSNVGAAKIALAMGKEKLWNMLNRIGFGQLTGCQLPGESVGIVNPPERWVKIDHAVLSFGYGISVTPLQLARAYAVLANGGLLIPTTVLRQDGSAHAQRVMTAETVKSVRGMLERAVGAGGTGTAAQVQHYRVAGKTGTVHKLMSGNYSEDRYVALFAGLAPASHPRLVMVVTIDDPKGDKYYGGQVAAPVFSKVMASAMRILNIPPDAPYGPDRWVVEAKMERST